MLQGNCQELRSTIYLIAFLNDFLNEYLFGWWCSFMIKHLLGSVPSIRKIKIMLIEDNLENQEEIKNHLSSCH
jgi:hypothetical protein